MKTLKREFFGVSRSDVYRLVPIGDVHIGAAACDEKRLRRVVEYIAATENCYWVGMGDYADFINRSDPRFSPATLASWIRVADLADLARAQRDRFLDIVRPIAGKCLAMLEGNHETAIARHYERDIYSDIVAGIKDAGRFPAEHQLALGYYGYLRLLFYGGDRREASRRIVINLHHGFVGGRLAGAKALNMQRWLWTHNADVVIFGHSHNTGIQLEAVEQIDRAGNVTLHTRIGCYAGTFLKSAADGAATYSEMKGYLPLPLGGVELVLRPLAKDEHDRVKVLGGS